MRDWNSATNVDFYRALSPNRMREYAIECGMHLTPDVKLIEEVLGRVDSILEVGGGYGRFTSAALERLCNKHYTIIEPVETYVAHLKERFGDGIMIFSFSLPELRLDPELKYDLICFPWSAITELRPRDQEQILSRMRKHLSGQGFIYLDILATERPGNASVAEEGWYIIEEEGRKLGGFTPPLSDLAKWLNPLAELRVVRYESCPGRLRYGVFAKFE